MSITAERQLGRAKNAVLTYFEARLILPKIYLNTEWAGKQLDVLAIDRDGFGDVHAVRVYSRQYFAHSVDIVGEARAADELLDELASTPAQFKYIAAVDSGSGGNHSPYSAKIIDKALASDGIGRVGFMRIVVVPEREPRAEVIMKPERFRASVTKLADEYVGSHVADWELRA